MPIMCSGRWLLVFRTQILVCGVLCSVDDKGERCTISGKINLSLFTINRNAPHLCERHFVAVRTGLEPATPCVTGMYSNQAELPHHSFGVYFPFGIANVRIIFDCANIIRHFFLFFHSIMLIEEYLSCNRRLFLRRRPHWLGRLGRFGRGGNCCTCGGSCCCCGGEETEVDVAVLLLF